MHFEVEQKFAVDDLAEVERRLEELGAAPGTPVTQSDRYFNHPGRDFARTDEALRIRTTGDESCVTYKGPKLDQQTKTRREIEVALRDGPHAAEDVAAMLDLLGFRFVADVRKHRRTAFVIRDEMEIEIALDEVQDLGSFVELETTAEENAVEPAKARIASLAADLGLVRNERRSYLELLLAKQRQ